MGDEPRQQLPEIVVGNADVRVCADVDALCDRLAEAIAGQVVGASGRVSLALTGGVTSARVYARLGQAHAGVRWSDVDFFGRTNGSCRVTIPPAISVVRMASG